MASTSGCKLSASPVLFVLNVALILLLITAKSASASQERTKTEEFNVRPGGVVHSFSQKMVSCSEPSRSHSAEASINIYYGAGDL